MSTLINGFEDFNATNFEAAENPLALIFNMQRMLMSACQLEELAPDIAFWVTETAMLDEVLEALENFKNLSKPWKRDANLDVAAIQEEVTDQLFFLVQAAILLGMDSAGLFEAYKEKYTRNLQRIIEKRNGMDTPL